VGLGRTVPAIIRSSITSSQRRCCSITTTTTAIRTSTSFSSWRRRLSFSGRLLVAFDGLEQRAEVAGSKSLIALALDDLEEEGPGFGIAVQAGGLLEEDLQQYCRGLSPSTRI